MQQIQDARKEKCRLLTVLCGRVADLPGDMQSDVYPKFVSWGCLQVYTLINPTLNSFCEYQRLFCPNLLFLQGEQLDDDELGSLVWGTLNVANPEILTSLFGSSLPSTVYLEVPNSKNIAQALHSKGVPYVIYWKDSISFTAASHFRQALLSVLHSSYSHIWDAFQLARATFRSCCVRDDHVLPLNCRKISDKRGPRLIGVPPKLEIPPPKKAHTEAENLSPVLPAIKIKDDHVYMRFLVCGVPCTLDAGFLGSLKDGLSALLNIEIRGSKLFCCIRATPSVRDVQDGILSDGVMTTRCDFITGNAARVQIFVSGSTLAFSNYQLQCHIKHELIDKWSLVLALPSCENSKPPSAEPICSGSIASGASSVEVCMKIPNWAAQVLKQLAREASYRTFAALGIASIEGVPVGSFDREDTERLFFCSKRKQKGTCEQDDFLCGMPMLSSAVRKRKSGPGIETAPSNSANEVQENVVAVSKSAQLADKPASMIEPTSSRVQERISLNPLPIKHECNRSAIAVCSEEEFLRDVQQFLVIKGHHRHVSPRGLTEFPHAILYGKRLDLFNLYKQVVFRGGFNAETGINWKGEVFPMMLNYTTIKTTNGVSSTLKKHYIAYLLEYELAHDDVCRQRCFLCGSGIPGNLSKCGSCGKWAHISCDSQQGLGVFEDYAKPNGLKYICLQCSARGVPNLRSGE